MTNVTKDFDEVWEKFYSNDERNKKKLEEKRQRNINRVKRDILGE